MTKQKSALSTRTQVIETLVAIQQGKSLAVLLDDLLANVPEVDKGFAHTLLLTTLRHWFATARLLDSLADKPIDELAVRSSLQLGMTQLLYLEIAEHAAIFETVEAVKQLDLSRATGIVNAILRKIAKNPAKYRKQCDKKHSLPNWLAKQIKQDWREHYDDLAHSLRTPAPMFLRVNQRQSDIAQYGELLQQADIAYTINNLTAKLPNVNLDVDIQAICLEQSINVAKLPNFDTGMVSVQDVHAMLAGGIADVLLKECLNNRSNNHLNNQANDISNSEDNSVHLLDACTAPSGKLAHFLELLQDSDVVKVVATKVGTDNEGNDKFLLKHQLPDASSAKVKVTAIDNEHRRLQRSQQTLERLGFTDAAKLICADATKWQSEQKPAFDVILLDAPCTATGVIRRHPDITLLRREDDVEQTVNLQKQILQNLWQQLKLNGYLIYATCSILKDENETQMLAFLADHSDAKEFKLNADWGIEQKIGRQCLPLDGDLNKSGGDGFYYAVLRKEAAGTNN